MMITGFGVAGMLLMVLFWVALIFGAVWLIRAFFRVGTRSGAARGVDRERNAREILDLRYARGELAREQYETMRQDLDEGGAS